MLHFDNLNRRRPLWTHPSEPRENASALLGAATAALTAAGCELVSARRQLGLETNRISGVPIEAILNSPLQCEDIRRIAAMLGHCSAQGYLGLLDTGKPTSGSNLSFEEFLNTNLTGSVGAASFSAWLRGRMEEA